ncbi:MAG TPA: hypothetical protein VKZ85_17400 [Woeseiaceae bacterium]|nr:hypothetical protein [Woeseiaceae bacterium]
MNAGSRPDGIEPGHVHGRGTRLHAWPTALVLFAIVLALAAGGSFGRRDTVTVDREGIRLSAEGPVRIRSGEFFEMLLTVETDREIRDAVLSVAPGIWRDVTINTMIPQPTDESFEDGAFAFRFGALRAGTRLLVKVDGQVNPVYPPGRKHGTISLADGGATLASLDYAMRVLP